MDDLDYLFAAFAVVWVMVFGYILLLSFRQRKLRQEFDLLEQKVTERNSGST